ncbi:MAG TPA: hypothetical protein PKC18_20915, partial [Lacipirellulaceae bacterium]|nr:hypothetical protein [Lacipirellulaceae bacterium]
MIVPLGIKLEIRDAAAGGLGFDAPSAVTERLVVDAAPPGRVATMADHGGMAGGDANPAAVSRLFSGDGPENLAAEAATNPDREWVLGRQVVYN